MPRSTITAKGQTTIPRQIRDYLKLRVGDKLQFIPQENSRVLLVPVTTDMAELQGILPRPARRVSLATMQKAILQRKGANS